MSYAQQDADNEFDEEIFDIFVEEATEVIEALDIDLPKWQADRANRPVLTEIRRAFHTLKGSGRMAKAMEIAEIAWKVEQALNKVLDGALEASDALIDIVFKARNAIPPLVASLKNRQPVSLTDGHLAQLCKQIDAVARGETLPPAAPVIPVIADVPAVTFADLEPMKLELADLSMQVASCTSVAEAARTHTRDLASRLAQLETTLQGFVQQSALEDQRNQSQLLANNLLELRHLVKVTNDRLSQQQAEAREALDQRLNDEITSLLANNSNLSDEILRLQQQVLATRRWAITIAGTFAGGAFILSLAAFLLLN